MQANLIRMQHALKEWLVKEEIIGDATFFSVREWTERGEPYLTDSLLILAFDSSSLYHMLNYGGDTSEFDDLIESFGFWYELGNAWNLGFYPVERYDFTPTFGTYSQKLTDQRWQQKARSVKERAGHLCEDCGESKPLEAHHCYYANMREGYEPWEYPFSAFRALCRECHRKRDLTEIRMRAFAASLKQEQIEALIPALKHAMYWYKPHAVFEGLAALGPDDKHRIEAMEKLKNGKADIES